MTSLPNWIAVLFIALGAPMAMKMVPLNGFYGFRTPKAMSSEAVWYESNRLAGINLILAGVFTLSVWCVVRVTVGLYVANQAGMGALIASLLMALLVSFLQLRNL